MNSGAKFDTFKNSLASLGKNSQSQGAGSQAKNNLQESNFSATHDPSNRGALRSAIKFDYELGQTKIASGNIKQVELQPSANIFSCMDSPNYPRDFEVSPKIMHR